MITTLPLSIIYNPNSTGDSKENAEAFYEACQKAGITAEIIATEHAGHAYEIATDLADKPSSRMIISSSGDGGYHEVVNGVLDSRNPDTVVGVLPSGNANDHYHFMHRGDTIQRIQDNDIDVIDIIKVTTPSWTHVAHSYVGLGLTPQIGEELSKTDLNIGKESWLVLTHLGKIRPVKLLMDGKVSRYDHVVFSNINKMSKYLKLTDRASVTDGMIEMTRLKTGSFLALIAHLFRRTLRSDDNVPQAKSYEFVVLRDTSVQLDGEVYNVASGETMRVECLPRALRTIV